MNIVGTPSNIVARCSAMACERGGLVEARQQHELHAARDGRIHDDVAVDVRARQRRDDDVRLRASMHQRGHRGVEQDRSVAEHRALRTSRRAGRVADRGGAVCAEFARRRASRRRSSAGLASSVSRSGWECPLARSVDDAQHARTAVHAGDLVVRDDHCLRAAIAGDEADLVGGQQDVARYDDAAQPQRRVVRDHPAPAVLHPQRDAVARARVRASAGWPQVATLRHRARAR